VKRLKSSEPEAIIVTPGIEKEPSTLKEAIGTKEPWQMTLEEYAYEEALCQRQARQRKI